MAGERGKGGESCQEQYWTHRTLNAVPSVRSFTAKTEWLSATGVTTVTTLVLKKGKQMLHRLRKYQGEDQLELFPDETDKYRFGKVVIAVIILAVLAIIIW